jgi:hypothetical protein
LKQHKLWFDEECLGSLDQSKQVKIQWVQEPKQSNVDNLNNVRREASRHFRNLNKGYLKTKIDQLETNSKKISEKLDINDFKKFYQPRTNRVRDEKADLITSSNSILVKWRKYIFQLFIVDGFSDVGLREIHTAEPLVLEPSVFEIEMTIEKLKSCNHQVLIKSQQTLLKQGE